MPAETRVYFRVIVFVVTKIEICQNNFSKMLPIINFMKTSQTFLEFQMIRDEPADPVKLR